MGTVGDRHPASPVARRVVDDDDPGRVAGHGLRDLGEDARERLGLVVGGDHDEDAAGVLAELLLLELRCREGPDQAPDPLRLAFRFGEHEEDQEVGDHHREDEHRDDPPDRLIAEPDEVLDRADDVGRDRDPEQPDADEQQRQDDRPIRVPSRRHDHDGDDREGDEGADEAEQARHQPAPPGFTTR